MAGPFADELLLDMPDGASNPSMAGASSATVTGTKFEAGAEIVLRPDQSAMTNVRIVATSSATTVAGTPRTIVTLPDGTVMTLVGVVTVAPMLFMR